MNKVQALKHSPLDLILSTPSHFLSELLVCEILLRRRRIAPCIKIKESCRIVAIFFPHRNESTPISVPHFMNIDLKGSSMILHNIQLDWVHFSVSPFDRESEL